MTTARDSDFEVFAQHSADALAGQERRLEAVQRRAMEVVGTASIAFALFGAFRGDKGLTWALVIALAGFVVLVGIVVWLQLPGGPWYFTMAVDKMVEEKKKKLDAGEFWDVNAYMAASLDNCYDQNAPKLDRLLTWLSRAFIALGAVVFFLVLDLAITNTREDSNGKQTPAATTTVASSTTGTP